MEYFSIPGLVDQPERELLRDAAQLAAQKFGLDLVMVNLGIFLGASCYALRAGTRNGVIYGVDINGWERIEDTPELRAILNMTLLQGDSKEVVKTFDKPIHVLFVDDIHNFDFVSYHCKTWAQKVVVGGWSVWHDAFYTEENGDWKYNMGQEVSRALDEGLSKDIWEEKEKVNSTRWFQRIK